MDAHQLGLDLGDLAVTDFVICSSVVVIRLASTATTAPCPECGQLAHRVHSRYLRTLADLACCNRSVLIRLQVRRFRCPSPSCPRSIFCERIPGLAEAHARTTARLSATHRLVGLVLGGEAGARLADTLAIPTSPDTILRRVKAMTEPSAPAPRFVGIDDWAWRKGQKYGTIVVDLERRQVIDLLPDRDAETVKKWLADHPGVELVSRDRGPTYIRAATEAAPQAEQVADRWHLLKNLREAIERLFQRQSEVIAQALKSSEPMPSTSDAPTAAPSVVVEAREEPPSPAPSGDQDTRSPRQQLAQARQRRRVERFEQVRERHREGHSARRIARELGLSRCTVRRYLRCKASPDQKLTRNRRSQWDEHREWIDSRLSSGDTNASALHRELTAQGFVGSYGSVRRYVAKRMAAVGMTRPGVAVAKPRPTLPSAKQLSFDWVRRPEARKPEAQARVDAIRGQAPELAAALTVADGFAELIRKRGEGTLATWLSMALVCPCPEVRAFAEGIRGDEAAVRAAVTGAWSNGPVEGQVNRLKWIKRSMFGRAGFTLLRARVIHAA